MKCIQCLHVDYRTPAQESENDAKWGKLPMKYWGVCQVAVTPEQQASFIGNGLECFTGRFESASDEVVTGRIEWFKKRG